MKPIARLTRYLPLLAIALMVAAPACAGPSATTTTTTASPTTTTSPPTTTTTPPTTTTSPPTTTTPPATTTTTPPPTTTAASVTIDLVAQNFAFDKSTITVPRGASVTINFNNKDPGVLHNFAAYTDSSASTKIFQGALITGPATTTYTFSAPSTPGTYFFRCDAHPAMMTGSFIVQ
jgi:plastocyanin